MHQGCVAYHGSPKTILHYFGVSALEEIYPKLQDRNGVSWCRSWAKHRESYYARLEKEREQKMLSGELPDPNAGPTDEQKEGTSTPAGEADGEGISSERASSGKETAAASETGEEAIPEVPGFFTQFFCLLGRRWRIFFRDRSQLVLQLVMVLLFPILVAMFTDKGTGQIVGLSATQDVQTLQKDIEAQQLNMKTGSAVSGIIMFEVILLGLMGSNNAAREVAGERAIMEKEKYAGMRPSSYLASKLAYLSVLVLVQSVWMFAFVDFFWDRGGSLTHLFFLILANAAMTFVCLGISSLAKSADQASLLSIYLVGFQLPLSGAVLALPEQVESFIRPFISAYWSWSGSISALKPDVYNAVKNVLDTGLTPALICYIVLGAHVAGARASTSASAVPVGNCNLMRAIAACSLYIFSTRDYGETTCSEKEEFIIICSDAGHRGGGSCAGACHRLCRDALQQQGPGGIRHPAGYSGDERLPAFQQQLRAGRHRD